jgi:hypothetical protein
VLGGVLGVVLVILPVFLLTMSINDLEDQNEEVSTVLRGMGRSRGRIAAMRAEKAARDQRYDVGPPGADWLVTQVAEHDMTFTRKTDEPPRRNAGYEINTSRVSFQGVGLRPVMLLLADLKNSRYPVAIERIHVRHSHGDNYNFELGVQTFARQGGRTRADAGVPAPGRPAQPNAPTGPRRAGPPSP